jgi:hypothetical protein
MRWEPDGAVIEKELTADYADVADNTDARIRDRKKKINS